mgnify:CR=1 FL=1
MKRKQSWDGNGHGGGIVGDEEVEKEENDDYVENKEIINTINK